MRPKDLEYYMSLDYPVEIKRISAEDGGGYLASIPSLGRYTFVADGETPQKAYEELEEVKRMVFAQLLEEGLPIPEPPSAEEDAYSGKFLVRMPKRLHGKLAEQAKQEGISLNQYIVHLLSEQSKEDSFRDMVEGLVESVKNLQRVPQVFTSSSLSQ